MHCNVCQSQETALIYASKSDLALTSLCEVRQGKVEVWMCTTCGHLYGEALPDVAGYYETDYRILLDHDDEDQIYEVRDDNIIYRTDHQVTTLLNKLNLPLAARVLDYGCAKAATPRRLLASRPDLKVHLFDVSAMYESYWAKFLPVGCWAMHETPESWRRSFDLVTSFFALEHIPDPIEMVRRVAGLLSDEGVFYGVVPDTFGNFADFLVVDHVNHFTQSSLHYLLRLAGFKNISIDSQAHRGALVFTAQKVGAATVPPELTESQAASRDLAHYWSGLSSHIRDAEALHDPLPMAIYGSGFYGAYIASVLKKPERVECFIDASPFQQGKTLFGRPILAPERLPDQIGLLYIGLNPRIAKTTVGEMGWLRERELKLIFLDEELPC